MSVKAAALSIHDLAAPEREAVLRALSPEERARLTPFLEQLKVLGIPSGASNRMQVDVPPTPPTKSQLPGSLGRCASLSCEAVLQCTKGQSAQTLAALLSIHNWPWKQEVLEQLPDPRKREVREFIQTEPSMSPAVQDVLMEALLTAAEKLSPSSERRAGLLRRLAPWMR